MARGWRSKGGEWVGPAKRSGLRNTAEIERPGSEPLEGGGSKTWLKSVKWTVKGGGTQLNQSDLSEPPKGERLRNPAINIVHIKGTMSQNLFFIN